MDARLRLGCHLQLHPPGVVHRNRQLHGGSLVTFSSTLLAEEEYVDFAKLKGVGEGRIASRYGGAANAILPQITMLALVLGGVFNGALITEILFSYPGVGSLIYSAVLQADYNLLMGTISLSILAVSTATFVVDLIYPFIDPRIRYR